MTLNGPAAIVSSAPSLLQQMLRTLNCARTFNGGAPFMGNIQLVGMPTP
ncbi:hypothetical protein SOM61_15590 [Massilia sp. CFBP9012]|nr:hypothetical protein [Massilia sp. CFBP9012]MDY0976395.1 hypothetical protein [Massilia sp. CFBP9012]